MNINSFGVVFLLLLSFAFCNDCVTYHDCQVPFGQNFLLLKNTLEKNSPCCSPTSGTLMAHLGNLLSDTLGLPLYDSSVQDFLFELPTDLSALFNRPRTTFLFLFPESEKTIGPPILDYMNNVLQGEFKAAHFSFEEQHMFSLGTPTEGFFYDPEDRALMSMSSTKPRVFHAIYSLEEIVTPSAIASVCNGACEDIDTSSTLWKNFFTELLLTEYFITHVESSTAPHVHIFTLTTLQAFSKDSPDERLARTLFWSRFKTLPLDNDPYHILFLESNLWAEGEVPAHTSYPLLYDSMSVRLSAAASTIHITTNEIEMDEIDENSAEDRSYDDPSQFYITLVLSLTLAAIVVSGIFLMLSMGKDVTKDTLIFRTTELPSSQIY